MKKLALFASAAILGVASLSAQADNAWSLQYSMYDLDAGTVGSFSPSAVEASYRYGIQDNIAIEGYVGTGVADDDDVEITLTYGIEAIYSHELSDGLSIEGMLGYAYGELDSPGGSTDDTALAYGISAAYGVGSGAVYAQYRSIDFDDIDTTTIDIGYRMPLN